MDGMEDSCSDDGDFGDDDVASGDMPNKGKKK